MPYHQALKGYDLALEMNTDIVEKDDRFHVLRKGVVLASFDDMLPAQEFFWAAFAEDGFTVNSPVPGKTLAQVMTERYYRELLGFDFSDGQFGRI